MLFLVPQSGNLYPILQWHLKIGANLSLHQISPFQILHGINFPLPAICAPAHTRACACVSPAAGVLPLPAGAIVPCLRFVSSPAPGMVRLWSLEAYAHGASTVSYFRWRQAPFAQEQMHSGLNRADDVPDVAAFESQAVRQVCATGAWVSKGVCPGGGRSRLMADCP